MHPFEAVSTEGGRPFIPELSETERKVFRILKTVLLVEDDDDLRYVMECSLKAMGYVVISCADAQLASTAFHRHPAIDILLTDFDMPGRSGVEFARELTTLRSSLPVVILTGSLLSETILDEIHDRQWTYVRKPCHFSALKSILQILTADRSVAA